jgi:hypothetical protein
LLCSASFYLLSFFFSPFSIRSDQVITEARGAGREEADENADWTRPVCIYLRSHSSSLKLTKREDHQLEFGPREEEEKEEEVTVSDYSLSGLRLRVWPVKKHAS